jgi:hypothetical protein
MRPWFIREDNVVPFPNKDTTVLKLPNVGQYPDFLTGVSDLQARVKQGTLSDEMYKKLYTELLHRFMRTRVRRDAVVHGRSTQRRWHNEHHTTEIERSQSGS